MDFTAYQSFNTLLLMSPIMPRPIVLLLGTIIVPTFLFKFGTNTMIKTFWNTITFTRLVFILLTILESIMDIPYVLKALVAISAMIIDIYTQTIKMLTMNAKLLVAMDEDGLPLIRHGPERQELQSFQKYTFVVAKLAMVVFAILTVTVGVALIAGVIQFVYALSKR